MGGAPAGSASRGRSPRADRPRWAVPDLHALRAIAVPSALADVAAPDVDHLTVAADLVDWSSEGARTGLPGTLIPPALLPHGAVYSETAVERTVFPRPNNPRPVYPAPLLATRTDGRFLVTFVVDTTGRVEPPSIAFPATAHALFVQTVRRTLLRSRYFPAEVAGRPVRQEVHQEFVFRISP
jgi:TonB family protein